MLPSSRSFLAVPLDELIRDDRKTQRVLFLSRDPLNPFFFPRVNPRLALLEDIARFLPSIDELEHPCVANRDPDLFLIDAGAQGK